MDIVYQISLNNRNDKKTIEILENAGYKPQRIKSQLYVPINEEEMFWKILDLEL